ncbi:MAG: hypothetical protein KDB22_13595 [Planctomycetales bacterium]|nr:hypothetical protein [Planctomycetales bacterium]
MTDSSNDLQFSSLLSPDAVATERLSRRAALGRLVAGFSVSSCLLSSVATAAEPATRKTGLLARSAKLAQLNTQNKIVLELEGKLHIQQPDPKQEQQVREAEVKATSTLEYFEKIAFQDAGVAGAARRYVEAQVQNWISGSAGSYKLRPECSETRMLLHDGYWQQYCEQEPLKVREVELLQSPINSSALELLLPTKPATPNAKWQISAEDATAIFNLDAVHRSTIGATIAKVEKGKAIINLSGELDATANSVPTTLKINGNCHASLGSQGAFISWFSCVIEEDREISEKEPGFSIQARIRLLRAETDNNFRVTADQLRDLAAKTDDSRWLVRLDSTHGKYTMLVDRNWKMYLDGGEESILRFVKNNDVIAQCNIMRLTNLSEGSQLTLEGLNADIKKSLGEGFDSFLESSERTTSTNLRLMRSVAVGQSEDVPVQWIYAHLSNDSGQRVAMVYTMGASVAEQFAAADEQMITSFELLPQVESKEAAAEPKSAPQLTSNPQATQR